MLANSNDSEKAKERNSKRRPNQSMYRFSSFPFQFSVDLEQET